MDPLSDVLSRLRPTNYTFRGLDAGGEWAIRFPASRGINCYAIQSGTCLLAIEEAKDARLNAGDVVLVSRRYPVRLFSSADAPVTDAVAFLPTVGAGETAVLNGGGACFGVGGFFEFEGFAAEMLLPVLPPMIHIRADATREALAGSIERLMAELREPQPGSELIAAHLGQALLVEALRLSLLQPAAQACGWLCSLGDPRIRAAISAIHAEPDRAWTLATLAAVAGMSRSSFAEQFKRLGGEPPVEYLTRWRMLLAAERLTNDRARVADVASSVGYQSESAFGAAFKRFTGQSPKQFVKAHEAH